MFVIIEVINRKVDICFNIFNYYICVIESIIFWNVIVDNEGFGKLLLIFFLYVFEINIKVSKYF